MQGQDGGNDNSSDTSQVGSGDDSQSDDAPPTPRTEAELRAVCDIDASREALFVAMMDQVESTRDSGLSRDDAFPTASDFCDDDVPEWVFEPCDECSRMVVDFVYDN